MGSPDLPSPEQPPPVDAPDWRLLRALFAEGEGFLHKMGVRRREFSEFYAPTADGSSLRRQKAALLGHGPSEYMAMAGAGLAVFREFAEALGHRAADSCGEEMPDWIDATRTLSLRTEPDFLLLTPPDWTLVWASVCFPSRWSLEDKLRRPLHEIHAVVPGLNAELGSKIATFFARMVPGEGWGRANWGLSASPARNQHPQLPVPTLTAWTRAEETFVRIEDQHLLKLSRTGGIAFGIRVLNFRLSEVLRDPFVTASLQEKLRTMPPDVAAYKGLTDYLTRSE